jgi:hypothetical protein
MGRGRRRVPPPPGQVAFTERDSFWGSTAKQAGQLVIDWLTAASRCSR